MVQTNFVDVSVDAEGGYVNPNHQRVKKITEKKNPWIKIAAIAGAIGIVFAGGVGALAIGGLLDQGGGGPGGWNILPGGDDNGQDDDNDGHNNNNNNNNHAPDSFVNYMKNLGVEGEGWDDEAYDAAYNLQNNGSMSPEVMYENINKIINPLDPKGTVTLAKQAFLPKIGDNASTYENIANVFKNYGNNENYIPGMTHIKLGGYSAGNCSYESFMRGGTLIPEFNDYYNFIYDSANAGKMTVSLGGKVVSVGNAEAYLGAVVSIYDTVLLSAVNELGSVDALKASDAYKAWFDRTPSQGNSGEVVGEF